MTQKLRCLQKHYLRMENFPFKTWDTIKWVGILIFFFSVFVSSLGGTCKNICNDSADKPVFPFFYLNILEWGQNRKRNALCGTKSANTLHTALWPPLIRCALAPAAALPQHTPHPPMDQDARPAWVMKSFPFSSCRKFDLIPNLEGIKSRLQLLALTCSCPTTSFISSTTGKQRVLWTWGHQHPFLATYSWKTVTFNIHH